MGYKEDKRDIRLPASGAHTTVSKYIDCVLTLALNAGSTLGQARRLYSRSDLNRNGKTIS